MKTFQDFHDALHWKPNRLRSKWEIHRSTVIWKWLQYQFWPQSQFIRFTQQFSEGSCEIEDWSDGCFSLWYSNTSL